ncbi:hypothetical protein niasHS_008763 [Heterodera schachtii]|uniref:Uncharacterized protein n=1 Tax=Heterodera schachtii TaxID=97005 RepID=A0ABD2J9Z7_HETSC
MIEEREYECFAGGKCALNWQRPIGSDQSASGDQLAAPISAHLLRVVNIRVFTFGDQWQCTAQFEAISVNMSNAFFVPPLVKSV